MRRTGKSILWWIMLVCLFTPRFLGAQQNEECHPTSSPYCLPNENQPLPQPRYWIEHGIDEVQRWSLTILTRPAMQQIVVVHGQDVAVIDVDVTFLSATWHTSRGSYTPQSSCPPISPNTGKERANACLPTGLSMYGYHTPPVIALLSKALRGRFSTMALTRIAASSSRVTASPSFEASSPATCHHANIRVKIDRPCLYVAHLVAKTKAMPVYENATVFAAYSSLRSCFSNIRSISSSLGIASALKRGTPGGFTTRCS